MDMIRSIKCAACGADARIFAQVGGVAAGILFSASGKIRASIGRNTRFADGTDFFAQLRPGDEVVYADFDCPECADFVKGTALLKDGRVFDDPLAAIAALRNDEPAEAPPLA